KATWEPSGDHAGWESDPVLLVRLAGPVPSAFITHTSLLPLRLEVKATWAPSWDHAGRAADPVYLVRLDAPPPSPVITHTSPPRPGPGGRGCRRLGRAERARSQAGWRIFRRASSMSGGLAAAISMQRAPSTSGSSPSIAGPPSASMFRTWVASRCRPMPLDTG